MNGHETAISIHAHMLMSALVDVHNAKVKFEVLAQEKQVYKKTKKKILQCVNECSQIRTRFDRFWGEEGSRVMDEQILSDEDSLQIQNINQLSISVPKGIRNQIEQFAEGLANVYAKNR